MIKNRSNLFALVTVLLFAACKDEENTTIPYLGKNYYPNDIGHWVIYDVDSTYKIGFDPIITHAHYQIKEIITDTFLDNEGRTTLRLERYRKDSTNYPEWTIYQVWTANVTPNALERYEDNIRFIKMQFPITNNASWNGNSKNILPQLDYTITNAHSNDKIGALVFDSVTTILHSEDTNNIIDRLYEYEKYAANAGLVLRYTYKLEQQPKQNTNIFDTIAYYTYKEQAIDYKR